MFAHVLTHSVLFELPFPSGGIAMLRRADQPNTAPASRNPVVLNLPQRLRACRPRAA